MKKRIVIAIVIIILLTSLSLINSLSKVEEEYDPLQEINKCMEQENASYRENKGKIYCFITNSTTTSEITTTTKTKKKTTKKTTQRIKVNENEITSYLYQEVLNMGWSSSDYEIIVKLLIKESGINPNSYNKKSTACGLFQAKPCSKAIKAYPDYLTNYKSQVKWGLKYIKDRYGTPTKAWQFWQEHKWY